MVQKMKILYFIVYFVITCVLPTMIFGYYVERDGTVLKYRISNKRECAMPGDVLKHFLGRGLDQCVYNCAVKPSCEVINYKRNYGFCELRSQGNDEEGTDKIKGCVTVKRSDITILKMDNTSGSCNTEGQCHYEGCSLLQLENGHVRGNMYGPGSKREIECDDGFQEVSNITQVTCLPNGSWSHVPACFKAEFYCANNYNYGLIDLYASGVKVDSKTSIAFQTKGEHNAHLLLQGTRGDEDNDVVEIVLGGYGNGKSVLRNQKQGPALLTYSGAVLVPGSYVWFWISWTGGCVQVGQGSTVGSNVIMNWCGLTHSIAGMAISYGYGSDGYYKFARN